MNTRISLFDPTAPAPAESRQKRHTLDGLEGKVVGFIDNAKPNFNYLVDELAEILVSKHGVKSIVKHQKRAASVPVSDEVINNMAGQCDLVITGSGD